jgi:hypothetical protein
MFWAFLIFWPLLTSLSLFLPRADFPNVASVKTVFSTANYRDLFRIDGRPSPTPWAMTTTVRYLKALLPPLKKSGENA